MAEGVLKMYISRRQGSQASAKTQYFIGLQERNRSDGEATTIPAVLRAHARLVRERRVDLSCYGLL